MPLDEEILTIESGVELEPGSPEALAQESEISAASEREKLEKEPKVEEEIEAKEPDSKEIPAYVPNKKFKVLDKEQEFEEWITPLLKDADTEKKVRDLFEKAYGLDHVKSQRETEKAQREKIEQSFNSIVKEIQEVSGHVRNKDYGRLFKELQINKQEIAHWLVEQHEIEEKLGTLPEPIKKVYNEYGNLKETVENLNRTIEEMRSGSVDSVVQARTTELNQRLTSPDLAPFVQSFDARLAKPGAFEEFVIRHGRSEWELNKRDLSAKEAVDEVLKYLGHTTQVPSQDAKPNESAAKKAVVIPAPKATVIPNVGTGSSSSTRKRVKSLDDLRKLAKSFQESA